VKIIITAIALGVACVSAPASAMNSWDWANMFRSLADVANAVKPAAPAVVIVAPAVIAPIPVTGAWVGGSPPSAFVAPNGCSRSRLSDCTVAQQDAYKITIAGDPTDDAAPNVTDCEDKPYIQYKDELHVFGDKATLAQLCQIKSQASLSCDRELIKITLALKAADISVEGCAEPSSLPLLETGW
jgi:hypothetical protein